MTDADRRGAARLLGHDFARPALLAEALTHPSALPARRRKGAAAGPAGAAPPRDYERLEFLGDRVLGLVVADLLWRRFDAEPEGPLTRRLTRSSCVARHWPRWPIEIGLDSDLSLSPAEAAAGAARNPGDPGRCAGSGDRGDLSRRRV